MPQLITDNCDDTITNNEMRDDLLSENKRLSSENEGLARDNRALIQELAQFQHGHENDDLINIHEPARGDKGRGRTSTDAVNEMEERLYALEAEKEEMAGMINALEKDNSKLKRQNKDLEDAHARLATTSVVTPRTSQHVEPGGVHDMCTSMEEQLKHAEKKRAQLQRSLHEATVRREEVEEAVSQFSQELVTAREDCDAKQYLLEELQEEYHALQSQPQADRARALHASNGGIEEVTEAPSLAHGKSSGKDPTTDLKRENAHLRQLVEAAEAKLRGAGFRQPPSSWSEAFTGLFCVAPRARSYCFTP